MTNRQVVKLPDSLKDKYKIMVSTGTQISRQNMSCITLVQSNSDIVVFKQC